MGIGLGTYVEVTGFGGSEYARVELNADGTVCAVTGSTPIGTGHVTTWAMLVADRLGMPLEDVAIVYEGRYIGKETIGALSMDVYNLPALI